MRAHTHTDLDLMNISEEEKTTEPKKKTNTICAIYKCNLHILLDIMAYLDRFFVCYF